MRNTPTNSDDMIDSRDIIARIEELEEERDALRDDADECADDSDEKDAAVMAVAAWYVDNGEELKALKAFADQAEGYASDWHHGAQLIRDSYFTDYARELADDLHGAAIRYASWPMNCIEWDQAASELQQDYSAVEFDGATYWVR